MSQANHTTHFLNPDFYNKHFSFNLEDRTVNPHNAEIQELSDQERDAMLQDFENLKSGKMQDDIFGDILDRQ